MIEEQEQDRSTEVSGLMQNLDINEVPIKSLPKSLQQYYSIDIIRNAEIPVDEK